MPPILPLLLILLFSGSAGDRGARAAVRLDAGVAVERRMIAALVETVRAESEREAASSVAPRSVPVAIPAPVPTSIETPVRESDRVRDGPQG